MGISREGLEPGIRSRISRGPASSLFFPPVLRNHVSEVISQWTSQQLDKRINTVLGRGNVRTWAVFPRIPAHGYVLECYLQLSNDLTAYPSVVISVLTAPHPTIQL